jgi:hypothetical protein
MRFWAPAVKAQVKSAKKNIALFLFMVKFPFNSSLLAGFPAGFPSLTREEKKG